MDIETRLMLSVLSGSIGAGYFVYGKKQSKFIALLSGILLCAYPYFVSTLFWTIGIGMILIVLPFLFRA